MSWRAAFQRFPALGIALPAYVASRAVLFLAGWLASALLAYARPWDPRYPGAVQTWLSWDAVHYLRIAQHGYPTTPGAADLGYFPLLPAILFLLGGAPASAFGFGLAAGLAAVVAVVALTRRVLDDAAARRTAWVVSFWPAAFVLSAVYTEGLFLALAAGALWAAWRGRTGWVVVLGVLAGLLRPTGAALALPLLVLLPSWRSRWAALAPLAGLAAFGLFLWIHAGHPYAFLHSQTANHPVRPWHSPFDRFLAGNPDAVVGLLALLGSVLLLWPLLRLRGLDPRWRWAAPLTVLALLTPPLVGGTLASFGRYAMVAFPLFWAVASLRVRLLAVAAIPAAFAITFGAGAGRLTP